MTEKPDGPLTGLLYVYDQRYLAVSNHAAIEGHQIGVREILESYDRTLHPWKRLLFDYLGVYLQYDR